MADNDYWLEQLDKAKEATYFAEEYAERQIAKADEQMAALSERLEQAEALLRRLVAIKQRVEANNQSPVPVRHMLPIVNDFDDLTADAAAFLDNKSGKEGK